MNNGLRIVNDVLFGENGWFFLWQGRQNQFEYLMGTSRPTSSSVINFADNMRTRAEKCAKMGLGYLHVIFPSKPVVMTEFLPGELRHEVRSLFERSYADIVKEQAITDVLYLRDKLLTEKLHRKIFLQQDTHMTPVGNAIAVREILQRLGHDHDPLAHMRPEVRPHRGDLADMAGLPQPTQEIFLLPDRRVARIWDNRRFLPGNGDNIAIARNPRSASEKRLLILGDSFIKDCLTPLSTFYRDILYVRSDTLQPDIIEQFGPDDVITANAERYMSHIRSDLDSESVLLRWYGRPEYKPSAAFVAALRAQLGHQAYHRRYLYWAHEADSLSFDYLGTGVVNGQLRPAKGDPTLLLSDGIDPQILFFDTVIEAGSQYELNVVMESDSKGFAQLFESDGTTEGLPFSESLSRRLQVARGMNRLKFPLPPANRGKKLRFDPLNCAGKIRILAMTLTELGPTRHAE